MVDQGGTELSHDRLVGNGGEIVKFATDERHGVFAGVFGGEAMMDESIQLLQLFIR